MPNEFNQAARGANVPPLNGPLEPESVSTFCSECHCKPLKEQMTLILPVALCPIPLLLPPPRLEGQSGRRRIPAWGPVDPTPAGGAAHPRTPGPAGVGRPTGHRAERADSWDCCHSPVNNQNHVYMFRTFSQERTGPVRSWDTPTVLGHMTWRDKRLT